MPNTPQLPKRWNGSPQNPLQSSKKFQLSLLRTLSSPGCASWPARGCATRPAKDRGPKIYSQATGRKPELATSRKDKGRKALTPRTHHRELATSRRNSPTRDLEHPGIFGTPTKPQTHGCCRGPRQRFYVVLRRSWNLMVRRQASQGTASSSTQSQAQFGDSFKVLAMLLGQRGITMVRIFSHEDIEAVVAALDQSGSPQACPTRFRPAPSFRSFKKLDARQLSMTADFPLPFQECVLEAEDHLFGVNSLDPSLAPHRSRC